MTDNILTNADFLTDGRGESAAIPDSLIIVFATAVDTISRALAWTNGRPGDSCSDRSWNRSLFHYRFSSQLPPGRCVPSSNTSVTDLLRFWLGLANKSVTDGYSKLKEDIPFRKKVVEQVGIAFELPADKREVAPNCTQSELLSTFA